jgi:hypothetical protein
MDIRKEVVVVETEGRLPVSRVKHADALSNFHV